MKKIIKLFSQTTLIVSLFFLAACGGGSESNGTSDKIISGKLLPPDGDNIYFGAFTDFGSHEDDVTLEKIESFDWLAGKPIAWSYFSNNWMYNDSEGKHQAEIRYPEYNIHQVIKAGKTPFVRLLPWTSPHQIALYSNPARTSKTGDNVIGACVDPAEIPVNDVDHHRLSILISKDEFNARQLNIGTTTYTINSVTEGLCANDFSMQKIIDGDWDDNLREWANEAKNDRDENGDIIPLLVTFTVEMNGAWFPWSGIYNGGTENNYKPEDGLADGPERYRDAYRHIIDLFREEGVTNITWFFAPDVFYRNTTWMPWMVDDWNLPESYYPGDDYIDWIGFTMYGGRMWMNKNNTSPPNTIEKFSSEIARKYPIIQAISTKKPYAILETSTLDYYDGRKSIWLTDMFDTVLNNPDYSNIKALSFWNDYFEDDKTLINHNIDSSEETLTTFQQLISNPRFISELRFSE